MIAQAGHGVSKAIWTYRDHPAIQSYMNDIDSMTKVVLSIPNLSQLNRLGEVFKENSINHVMWIEQPGSIPTCNSK